MDESGRLLEPLSPRNYTAPLNYAGVPALTVPCGFDAEELPIGLQLVGRHWAEGTLLAVAHAYQAGDRLAPAPAAALRVTGRGASGAAQSCAACSGRWPDPADRIAELPSSVVYLHADQFFPGWSVLVLRRHATELFELDPDQRARLIEEVSDVARALRPAFDARKVNYALFGNLLPHVHWHIIPRLADDPAPREPVFAVPHEPLQLQAGRSRRADRPDPESPPLGERRHPRVPTIDDASRTGLARGRARRRARRRMRGATASGRHRARPRAAPGLARAGPA